MGNSIARALRHRELSPWRCSDDERVAFYRNLQQLDREVKDCMMSQRGKV